MKRSFVTAALVVGLVVQVAHAAPTCALAGLRAVACCASECHHARSVAGAMRCCGAQVQGEMATTAPALAKELKPQLVSHVDAVAPAAFAEPFAALRVGLTPHRERAAPLFLVVRSLRL